MFASDAYGNMHMDQPNDEDSVLCVRPGSLPTPYNTPTQAPPGTKWVLQLDLGFSDWQALATVTLVYSRMLHTWLQNASYVDRLSDPSYVQNDHWSFNDW